MSARTSLGMPVMPPPTTAPTWKSAWDSALYGRDGFFRRESPAAHFRTSVHASGAFAEALVRLTRAAGLDTVVDIGAGRGELLARMREVDPGLALLAVEVAPRPEELHPAIGWTSALPAAVTGLVVANEWLDDIPCHVVEVDRRGVPRIVHVDPLTGEESLGAALTDPGVPRSLADWCARWWPLEGAAPGTRAEVGTSRDAAWRDVVRRVRGLALMVDYGHTRADRPPLGTLASYRAGRRVDVLPDGSRDVTAHVAVDAVAAAVGGGLLSQRDALRRLGLSAARPGLAAATADPSGYLRDLATATEVAELTAQPGLGSFWWLLRDTRSDEAGLPAPLR